MVQAMKLQFLQIFPTSPSTFKKEIILKLHNCFRIYDKIKSVGKEMNFRVSTWMDGWSLCVYFQVIIQIFAILVNRSTIIAVVGWPPGFVQKPVLYFKDSLKYFHSLVLLRGFSMYVCITNFFLQYYLTRVQMFPYC